MITVEVLPIKDAYNVSKDQRYLIECFNCGTILSYDYTDIQYSPEQNKFDPSESYWMYVQCPVCRGYHKHTGEEAIPLVKEKVRVSNQPVYGRSPIMYNWKELEHWYNPFKWDSFEIDADGYIWKNRILWRSTRISNP